MTIRMRTTLLLLGVCAIGAVLTFVVLVPIESARRQVLAFNRSRVLLAAAIDRSGIAAVEDGYAMLATGRDEDRQRFQAAMDTFDGTVRQFESESVAGVAGRSEEQEILTSISAASARLRTTADVAKGPGTAAQVARFRETADALDQSVDALGEVENRAAQAASDELTLAVVRARNIALAAWALAVVIVVAGGWLLARAITAPILYLRDAAARIAGGDLSTPIKLRQRGELGELAGALQTMQHNLADSLGRLGNEVTERTGAEAEARRAAEKLEVANADLADEVSERRRAHAQLIAANERLESNIWNLEQVMRENDLLTELAGFLQSDIDITEAHDAIGEYARRLFPGRSGGFYALDDSCAEARLASSFGEESLAQVIQADACWAIRLAHAHAAADTTSHLACPHLNAHPGFGHVCVPLVAHGATLGAITVLHPSEASSAEGMDGAVTQDERLAVRLAEHAALALSSLQLRVELRNQSIHDPLTGLYNRRYLAESMDREVARANREARELGVLMIDVDHFKQFNDAWGHEAGDEVLAKVGEWLRDNSRAEDIVSRWGGEEFVVVLPNMPAEEVVRWADRLHEGVRRLRVSEHPSAAITVSVGAAVLPTDGSTADELMSAADSALYRAKAQGRDRVVLASRAPGPDDSTRSSRI